MTGVNVNGRLSPNKWPGWKENKLRELAKQALSARDIAEQMGITRNQVIGKLRRLGVPLLGARTAPRELRTLVPRKAYIRSPNMTKVVRKVNPGNGKLRPAGWDKPITDPIVPVNNGKGITILELKHDKCHTVVGSSRPAKGLPRYCGRPAWNATAYCEDHYAVLHRPPSPR